MLHLEIRQENDQRSAYSVDHNPNGPVDVLLLREDDDWDNIENAEDIYFSIINEQGKSKIRFGIDEGLSGNPGENISPKGVLFSEDDNILGIVIALFNAAPGQQFLREFSTEVSNGSTEPQLADRLAAHPAFTRDVMGGSRPRQHRLRN